MATSGVLVVRSVGGAESVTETITSGKRSCVRRSSKNGVQCSERIRFRSVILPLKALVMNTLSVAASFGALVLVFQHGVGYQLVGLPGPLGNMLVAVPIVIFCC